MEVTLIGASWDVVAGDQDGSVDFIPMKFCGEPSCLALGVGALSGRGAGGRVPYCLRVIPRVQVFFAHKGCAHKSATCVSLAK